MVLDYDTAQKQNNKFSSTDRLGTQSDARQYATTLPRKKVLSGDNRWGVTR